MEVSAEAKRVMVVALGKLYSSRAQRGGLRLHRSLLLTMVLRSARDIYQAAQGPTESPEWEHQQPAVEGGTPEPTCPQESRTSPIIQTVEDKENHRPPAPVQHGRKRPGKATMEPDFLPCKKARLDHGGCCSLVVSSVLVDYVNCGGELSVPQTSIPLQTVIAAC
uniref:Immediate early response gene 2 protein-like n=2 Tax=Gouania willdenowi TaxID=441366 RepID=A0A8C5EWJ6_GOUWI